VAWQLGQVTLGCRMGVTAFTAPNPATMPLFARRSPPPLALAFGLASQLVACASDSSSNAQYALAVGGSGVAANLGGDAAVNASQGGNAVVGGAATTNAGGNTTNTNTGGASAGGVATNLGGNATTSTAPPVRATLEPNKTLTCEAPGVAVAAQHIEAECAFGASKGSCKGTTGGQQGTQLENADTDVGFIEGGDYLYFSDIVLDGLVTIQLHYAKGVDGGKLEVRLDSATGQLIGTLTPNSTGSWSTWADATATLGAATGSHTLYLVAAGSTAGIASIDWIELTAGGSNTAPTFHMNQVGFDTLGPKHAVIEGPSDLTRFLVVGSDGKAYWCGKLSAQSFGDWGSSKFFYSVDFTELTRAGTYRLQVGSTASSQFEVTEDRLFSKTLASVLSYFKSSRADDADVWAADGNLPIYDSSNRIDARGGWYDASGDISKYLTHLSYANFLNPQQIPLVAWALGWVYDQGGAALSVTGNASAVQAEALWGADYLLRVLDPTGFFYTTVFDQWSGNLGQRQICAFDGEAGATNGRYQSALREGGGMSIAALARAAAWKVDGAFTSAQYLAGAEKAFAHLNTNGVNYADDGKENVIDDYTGLLAASELFAATRNSKYLDAARARATSLVSRLSTEGYFIADGATRPFWHASDAGLPTVALARYVQLESDEIKKATVRQAISKHLDYLVRVTQAVTNPFGYARQHTNATTTSFFISHINESGYWWQGENARLSSLAAAALLGADTIYANSTQYLDLLRFAGTQLDWVLGANPFDTCFLHGHGTKNPPGYCGAKTQSGTLVGGIANGITGKNDDGSGIQFMGGANSACGNDWRWVEQWLPHAAWYMVATTALAK